MLACMRKGCVFEASLFIVIRNRHFRTHVKIPVQKQQGVRHEKLGYLEANLVATHLYVSVVKEIVTALA